VKRRLIPALIVLMLASLACQFDLLMPTPLPTVVPSQTPTVTLTPTPTLTLTPTITPTPPLTAADGPALLELHMSDSKRGWGLIENMILCTTDGGIHWASVPLPGVTVDTASMGTFFYTADIAYFVVPVPEAIFGQFFATRDGGQTWEINPVPFSTAQLYFVDDNMGVAFQTLSKTADLMTVAVYQTTDRGATWEQVFIHAANQGDTNLPVAGIKTGVSFANLNDGFIGLFSQENTVGLYHAPDAGHTWARQDLEPPAGLGTYTSTAWPPFFFKTNQTDGFAPVDFVAADSGAATRVFYVTHDGGATWAKGGSIPDGTAYDFLDPQTGWAWGGHTIYFTADGAQSWAQLPVAFNRNERASIIDFVDIKNGWLVTIDQTKNRLHLYRTNDGGATWTVVIL
jgi:photosystem II stability/assembly factor-like uncharacterized protein